MSKSTRTMTDSKGREIPIKYVPQHDKAKTRLVDSITKKAVDLNAKLVAFREESLIKVIKFVQKSAETYDVALGKGKGNITLRSFDGLRKVQIAVQDNIEFDERLATAQQLITEYLEEISQGADPAILKLIHKAFYADQQGKLRTGAVLGLRTINIKHKKWRKAMAIIVDSITVQSSKQYVRVYTRQSTEANWDLIQLNIASA